MAKKKKLSDPDPTPIANAAEARAWAASRGITEVECLVPDLAGVPRGKIMPAAKFFEDTSMALPSSIFMQTISGEYPEEDEDFRYDPSDGDIELRPDFTTMTLVPWAPEPTAQVIHDAVFHDGRSVEIAPRQVLQRIVSLYREHGWVPVVAPELEFYLVKRNTDPDYPLEPPIGRSGRSEAGRRSYSISAVNEFDDVFEDIYAFAEAQDAGGRHPHPRGGRGADGDQPSPRRPGDAGRPGFPPEADDPRGGPGARHLRHLHGQADRPRAGQRHAHPPVGAVRFRPAGNIFTDKDDKPSPAFFHFIAGQQRFLPAATCMIAPYVNSYRRLVRGHSAPVNVAWGYDNRTTGLRDPAIQAGQPAGGEPRAVVGRQSLSRHGRFARLRLAGPDAQTRALGAHAGQRPRRRLSSCRWACWRRSTCSRNARS